jgi:phosphopantetheine adenylyltransferase
VREVVALGGDVTHLVPKSVLAAFKAKRRASS